MSRSCEFSFLETAGQIPGHLIPSEGELLFRLAKATKVGVIVELGSWKGRSTSCLALGSKQGMGQKVYAVDTFAGILETPESSEPNGTYDQFFANIQRVGLQNMVIPIKTDSAQAAANFDQKVGLIFIDANHSPEGVRRDFVAWREKMAFGGVMAFHDSVYWTFPGPRKLAEIELYKSRKFRNVGFRGSISYGTLVRKNTYIEMAHNLSMLLLREVSGLPWREQIPKPIKRKIKLVLAAMGNENYQQQMIEGRLVH